AAVPVRAAAGDVAELAGDRDAGAGDRAEPRAVAGADEDRLPARGGLVRGPHRGGVRPGRAGHPAAVPPRLGRRRFARPASEDGAHAAVIDARNSGYHRAVPGAAGRGGAAAGGGQEVPLGDGGRGAVVPAGDVLAAVVPLLPDGPAGLV